MTYRSLRGVAGFLLLFIVQTGFAVGQTGSGSPPQANSPEPRAEQSGDSRMLGVIPRFKVIEGETAPPLTSGQKFKLFARITRDPFNVATAGLQAGIEQASDSFHDYGQGVEGYGKRFGAALADSTSSAFFKDFFYPSVFKEDPRYFRLGKGETRYRVAYALTQEFVCHTDSGGRSVNFAKMLGALTAGALANTYYPDKNRGFGLTMSRWGLSIGYGSAAHLIDEFWPDFQGKVLHKRKK